MSKALTAKCIICRKLCKKPLDQLMGKILSLRDRVAADFPPFSNTAIDMIIMVSWDIPKVQSVLSEDFSCDFKWKRNIPHASHQNGVVETLIKSVRQSLNATCKNRGLH